jgi:hypothetical protein
MKDQRQGKGLTKRDGPRTRYGRRSDHLFDEYAHNPPPEVPAYNVSGLCRSIAKDETHKFSSPVLTAFHVDPPSMLLKTPPPVPAYNISGTRGLIAKDETFEFSSPVSTAFHVDPPSMLLKTPP